MRNALIYLAALIMFSSTAAAVADVTTVGVVGKDYESSVEVSCDALACFVNFPANPSHSVVRIQRVSCWFSSGSVPFRMTLSVVATPGGPALKSTFLEVATSYQAGANIFYNTMNAETSLLVGVNRYPVVILEAGGQVFTARCRITGTLAQ